MIKNSVTAKLVAGVAGLSMALSMAVMPVSAQTTSSAAELTAQVNSLLATIAALQAQLASLQGGSTGSTGASASLTMDLTMGSTGAQVVALQDFLIAKGHLVMPAGVAKGYFGALTRSAVVKYQMAKGIAPAAGYVGPMTRAAINAEGGVTTPTTPGTPTTPTTGGTEGQLDQDEAVGSVGNETLDEGEDDVEVLAIEFEAEDSDMTIDRVDVDFIAGSGTSTASDNLDDYVTEVTLMLDGKAIATMDVDEADEDDDVYSFRFSGLKGVVKDGDTAQLSVAVSAVGNIDSADMAAEWRVTIPADGIRATDTKGISDTYFSGNTYSETFSFGTATAGKIEVSDSTDNPDDMTVEVDEEEETDDVVMLAFEIEANDTDVTVTDIPVTITTANNEGVATIIKSLELYQGSTLLKSKTAATTTTFNDLDIEIDEDDSVELTVKAVITDIGELGFDEGDSATVSLTSGNVDAIEAEDANGDEVTDANASGSATGNDITFRSSGIQTEFVSASESVDSDATPDRATFTLKFKVTAFGDDAHISATSTTEDSSLTSVAANTGVNYDIDGATTSTATLNSTATKTSNVFKVDQGDTEEFTLTVVASNASGAFLKAQLGAVQFGSTTDAVHYYTHYVSAADYESDAAYVAN